MCWVLAFVFFWSSWDKCHVVYVDSAAAGFSAVVVFHLLLYTEDASSPTHFELEWKVSLPFLFFPAQEESCISVCCTMVLRYLNSSSVDDVWQLFLSENKALLCGTPCHPHAACALFHQWDTWLWAGYLLVVKEKSCLLYFLTDTNIMETTFFFLSLNSSKISNTVYFSCSFQSGPKLFFCFEFKSKSLNRAPRYFTALLLPC